MKFLTNWKTTITGVTTILSGLLLILKPMAAGNLDFTTINEGVALIVAGVGLIAARDFNKSSEESGAK